VAGRAAVGAGGGQVEGHSTPAASTSKLNHEGRNCQWQGMKAGSNNGVRVVRCVRGCAVCCGYKKVAPPYQGIENARYIAGEADTTLSQPACYAISPYTSSPRPDEPRRRFPPTCCKSCLRCYHVVRAAGERVGVAVAQRRPLPPGLPAASQCRASPRGQHSATFHILHVMGTWPQI